MAIATSTETALHDAYEQGARDATDAFLQRHMHRIADVLDAIDRHAGDPEQLRAAILTAMGHDAP